MSFGEKLYSRKLKLISKVIFTLFPFNDITVAISQLANEPAYMDIAPVPGNMSQFNRWID